MCFGLRGCRWPPGGSHWLRSLCLTRISRDAIEVVDEIIIRQAGTPVGRIGLSWLVHWRLSEWQYAATGLERFKHYHSAVERATRIFQRWEKPPLDDPDFYPFKMKNVNELRRSLRKMRDVFQSRLSGPLGDLEPLIAPQFLKIGKKRSKSFPVLASNRDGWEHCTSQNQTVMRQYLSGPRLPSASLFDRWFSRCKGVDPELLRQNISRVGSSPHARRNANF